MEQTSFAIADLDCKSAEGDTVGRFRGVASTDGQDHASDIIEAGAFGVIDPKHVALLRDHNQASLIGGWEEFTQDGNSLWVAGAISLRTELGRDTYSLMQDGFLNGLSVGFRPKPGGVVWDEKTGVRRISKATLFETSVVSMPCNSQCRVTHVKALEGFGSREAFLAWLTANGFDETEAAIIMTKGADHLLGVRPPGLSADDTARVAAALQGLQLALKGSNRHV